MRVPSLLVAVLPTAALAVVAAQQTPLVAPQVYLYPSPPATSSSGLPPALTPDQAASVLAHHLGESRHAFLPDALDGLEKWAGLMWDEVKVVTGLSHAGSAASTAGGSGRGRVLVVQDVQDPTAFLKAEPTFTLTQTSASAIESLLAPFLHRAADVLTSLAAAVEKVKVPNFLLDVFDLSSDDISQTLKLQLEGLSQWVDELSSSSDASSFEALKVDAPSGLPIGSDQRQAAEAVIEASISSLAASADQQPFILILTPPGSVAGRLSRRQQLETTAAAPKRVGSGPVFSIDQCFQTVDACTNATDACSGRGDCVGTKRAGKTCFSCECGSTNESDGVTQWAGARCEKKDVSSSFALILFTLVLLIFVAAGSVALLSSAGSEPLPSVLAAGGGGPKRD